MPVALTKEIGSSTLMLWLITESEECLRSMVTADDLASAGRFTHSQRRLEHLAWRAMLRHYFPDVAVIYDEVTCAPSLVGDGRFISVSHTGLVAGPTCAATEDGECRGMAALLISDRQCAVDVDSLLRNYDRASSKFVSPAEASLAAASTEWFTAGVWCVKEAVYKYAGRRGLDFLRDIEVLSVDEGSGDFLVSVAGIGQLPVSTFVFGGYMVASIA